MPKHNLYKETAPPIRKVVRDYLLANPSSSLRDVMLATTASKRTISYVKAGLIQEGRLRRVIHPQTQLATFLTANEVPLPQTVLFPEEKPPKYELVLENKELSTEELVSEITTQTGKEVRDLSVEEMRQILSKIARSSSIQPQVRIAAITQKHKIDSGEEDRHELGPGKPKTRREALERLSMLMKACGLQLVTDAMEQTFEIFKAQNEEKAVEQGQTIETTAETIDAQGSPSPVPAT